MSDAGPGIAVVGKDTAWMACGAVLSIGGGLPSVLTAYFWPLVCSVALRLFCGPQNILKDNRSLQVILLPPGQRAVILFATDVLFCLSANLVLVLGSIYGVQRYGKHTQPYPGISPFTFSFRASCLDQIIRTRIASFRSAAYVASSICRKHVYCIPLTGAYLQTSYCTSFYS